ncbi:MAG: apolipoprotein N-acyltransferase, partial [Phormidesmis sp.]
EWGWSRGPLYWTSLSYTQSPYNLVGLHLAQLAGPITVTAGIVAVNGCLAQWVWTRWGERKKTKDVRPLLLGGVLFVCIHLVGLGLYSLPLLDDPDSALSVGLVQGNVPTSEKLSAAGIRLSQQIYLEGYETLAADGADMVITPEGAIAQTWNASTQAYNPLMRSVVRNRVPLLLGTFAKVDMVNNQGKSTSSLLLLSSEDETPRGEATGEEVTGEEVTRGKVTGRYNKVKLVPLGEYWPLEKVLRAVAGSLLPWNSLAPGRFDQQLETPFGPVAAGLCYESAFAGLFRAQVARGGQAIFTASNNDPYPPRQMMQHHAQDVMRAVETDRWEVRVTNTGRSGVVDPHGRTLWLSKPGERIVHNAPIALRQSRTPYVRWGDWLTPLLLIGSLVSIRPLPAKKGGSLS